MILCPVLEEAGAQVFITASVLEVTPAPAGLAVHKSSHCPIDGVAMPPCLLLLREATSIHCLPQPLCQKSLAFRAASYVLPCPFLPN